MNILRILKNAFETYANSLLITMLGSSVLFVVIFVIYVSIFPTLFGLPIEEVSPMAISNKEELLKLMSTPQFLVKINLFMLLINCIIAPMSAGFYKIFDMVRNKEQVKNKMLFSYYNSEYTTRILGFVVVIELLKQFAVLALSWVGLGSLGFSVSIIISLLSILTIPIIIFDNQSLTNAMKQSARAVAPYMFTALVVLFVGIVFSFLGLLLFVFGVVFTLPFFYAVNYNLYLALNENKNFKNN